jgi:glycerophosphoryl diester phosphodiesterase
MLVSFLAAAQYPPPAFDIQGHRGARGLEPENSIPAFLLALDSGVTTLELDLAVSRDGQLVVSHEPWMNASICSQPDGNNISDADEMKFNLFQMDYADIKNWDCGSRGNPDFPQQKRRSVNKPLLRDVIIAAEEHIKNYTRYEVNYNIEIKSDPKGDNIYHPDPKTFSEMVIRTLDEYLPLERISIQSFDFRVLQYIHRHHPEIHLAALIESEQSVSEQLEILGFIPDIWSPSFKLLSKEQVTQIKVMHPTSRPGNHVRVIPWTVNEVQDMLRMKTWSTDGFITDYPDRALHYKNTLGIRSGQEK